MDDDERKRTRAEFDDVVNVTPARLEKWLDTDESKSVGDKDGGGESTGHQSGRHIVRILRSRHDELSDADYAHMRKVVGYVHRHTAQRPHGDVEHTPWRYSLLNWGHDPL